MREATNEVAAATAMTDGFSNASLACGRPRLTSGMTAKDSPRRARPRRPGMLSKPWKRGLRPEATFTEPSLARTATDQCVGPCTSSPLRRAIPPRRSLSSGTGKEPPGEVVEEGGREAEVAHIDALVLGVHHRPGLIQGLVALGEEAVGHAVREGGAEPAAVGEGGQDGRHGLGAGIVLAHPLCDGIHQRGAHGRAVALDGLGELELVAVLTQDLTDALERDVLAHLRRHAAVDPDLRAGGDHVDLLPGADERGRE